MKRLLCLLLFASLLLPAQTQGPQVPVLKPQVLQAYPHDAEAFTQGLLWHAGHLYESTGQWGQSSLRRVELASGQPLETVALAPDYFGEGLERVGDRLIQLTWQAGQAFVYDLASFELLETIAYAGEGWGLCYDGRYLFMSDGSSQLSIREAASFALIFRGTVTLGGQIVAPQLLNELECVGEHIYANAWRSDYIFRIDKMTGEIDAIIDAAALLSAAERNQLTSGSVLNGIAYNPETETFYLTGKYWPKLFEVIFVEA